MKADARETALEVLTACRRAEAWADGALRSAIRRNGLSQRDAALASRLTYGILQNRALLDYYLEPFQKGQDWEPVIWDILRIGACQILLMDRVPPSAAVNCAVEMAKNHHRARAAGMVNAVLRGLSRERRRPPEDLATRYSHPQWLVDRYVTLLGREEAERCLAANNAPAPTTIQRNPLLATEEQLLEELGAVSVTPHPWLEGCYEISGTGNLEELEPFCLGHFQIQDAASALVARAADCRPGQTVIDVCAAPGGKSFSAAMRMQNRGRILSFDLHPGKLRQIQQGAERLGITCIEAGQADGREPIPALTGAADAVLCDVPCSGLGIIRKKPDIRYKDPKALEGLPAVQGAILSNAAGYVRPGGVLVYSTCTILPEENEQVVRNFLQLRPDFQMEPFSLPFGGTAGEITLWPHRHQTDGFYLCKLRRHDD